MYDLKSALMRDIWSIIFHIGEINKAGSCEIDWCVKRKVGRQLKVFLNEYNTYFVGKYLVDLFS